MNLTDQPTVNIHLKTNADNIVKFSWRAADNSTNFPVDAKAKLQVKKYTNAKTSLLTLTTENGMLAFEADGIIRMEVPYEVASTITWQVGTYDLIVYSDTTEEVIYIAGGEIFVSSGVTTI